MHFIRALMDRIRGRNTQPETAEAMLDRQSAEFIAEVDTYVRVFGLDPSTPEILELKRHAREVVSNDACQGYLDDVNPYKNVTWHNNTLVISERGFGYLLMVWTLIRFHMEDYDVEAFERIRVDSSGTRIYGWGSDTELVRYRGGMLNPRRLNDSGNRVENAIAVIRHFTDLELEWQEMHKFHWIEVIKGEDGTWSLICDPEPAYA